MKTSIKVIALWLICYSAILFSGCTSTAKLVFDKNKVFKQDTYQSKMPFAMIGGKNNIAGVSDKGESRLAFDVFNGVNASFSFSPKKHLSFIVSYTTGRMENNYEEILKGPFTVYTSNTDSLYFKTVSSNANHILKQSNIDVAAGYYNKLGISGTLELIGGLSYGKANNKYSYDVPRGSFTTEFNEERKYIRVFAQPGLCYRNKNVEAALVTKFAVYNFLSQHFTYQYEPQIYDMERFAVTIEPSVHLGFGRKNWIIYADMGWVIPVYKTDVKWERSKINLGMNLRFGNKK